MVYTDEDRARDLAGEIAIAELVRVLIGNVFNHPDPGEFYARMRSLEDVTIKQLTSRRLWPEANDATETFIKEAASAYITKLIGSLKHGSDATGA